jgi:hypothetical protein
MRGADGVPGIAADDAEIGNHLSLTRRGHVGASLVDYPHELVIRRERRRPLEIRVAASADEAIGEAGSSGEHLDADLARAGVGDIGMFSEFQDLGTAEPSDTDVLPRHGCAPAERIARAFLRDCVAVGDVGAFSRSMVPHFLRQSSQTGNPDRSDDFGWAHFKCRRL